jgi:prevent-host-death family protein
LKAWLRRDNLVSMTRKLTAREPSPPTLTPNRWRLQDAKARFSEVVRLAHSEGPQHVTLHGRDAVVIVDAEQYRRLQGERSGQLLIDALAASPHREIEIAPERGAMPVRNVVVM